jgi:hypothetical protein
VLLLTLWAPVSCERKTGAFRCEFASVCWHVHGTSYGVEFGSLGAAAYFVGTSVTLVVVENVKKTGVYRCECAAGFEHAHGSPLAMVGANLLLSRGGCFD